jgi:hypothetical protein
LRILRDWRNPASIEAFGLGPRPEFGGEFAHGQKSRSA